VAARLAPQKSSPDGAVKKRAGRRCFGQANSPARSGLHQTLADMEVAPPTETKAVLEHRAPKTSPPILHTRGVESKVGPAVHCAPGLVMQTRLSRVVILPSAPLRARLRLTAETLGRRVKVGRAVHCASGSVMQTRLVGVNLVFPRPYGRGYELVICWCGKNTLLILHPAGRGLPALPDIRFWRSKPSKECSSAPYRVCVISTARMMGAHTFQTCKWACLQRRLWRKPGTTRRLVL